jgi:hypothetical protein
MVKYRLFNLPGGQLILQTGTTEPTEYFHLM